MDDFVFVVVDMERGTFAGGHGSLAGRRYRRRGNRMVPTPRALQLKEPVRAALRQMEAALVSAAGFDPATSRRTFVLLGSDYFSSLLMPRFARQTVTEAPFVTLQMLDYPSGEVLRLLSEGFTDAAVDRELDTPEWIAHKTLFRSYMLCVAAKNHPVLKRHRVKPGSRIPAEVFFARFRKSSCRWTAVRPARWIPRSASTALRAGWP